MSLVSEIKCARCDRKYSGVRSRCPYCGARRIGRGKYTEDADNTKGKMLISILIMSALVVAAGVLLFSAPIDADASPPPTAGDAAPPELSSPEDDVVTEPGENRPQTSPPPEVSSPSPPEPPPPPGPEVRSVTVTFGTGTLNADFTERVGNTLTFGVRVEPVGVEEDIIWMSSNIGVFDIVELNPEGTQARLTAISPGTETLTVSVGGVTAEHTVRIIR